jgi:membrane protease YdiL (CAAX protease family)
MAPLSHLWRWFSRQLDAIDAEAQALARPGIPGWHTLVVVVLVTVMLGCIQMGVNDADIRGWAAQSLLTGLDLDEGLSEAAHANRLGFMSNLSWAGGTVLCYLVVPAFFVRVVFRRSLREFGWTTEGFSRHIGLYALLFAPVGILVVLMSAEAGFQRTYPFYHEPESWLALLVWELAYGLQFLALEFFFRGFMLHGLKHRYGHGALWVMLIPYVMIHFTKPPLEAAGAVIAGTVLGVLSLRTRSILGGVAIHAAVAWLMDLCSLWQRGVLWLVLCALVVGPSSVQAAGWSLAERRSVQIDGRQWAVVTLDDGQSRAEVWITTPGKPSKGVVLGLPGWRVPARAWEDHARISEQAEALGVTIALAEMGTTVYESAFYPQSRSDRQWCGPGCATPGSAWIAEVVVPFLQQEHGPVRGLFGLSTGGRGAVLVPQHHPELGIQRVCAMSGTFDLFALQPGTGEYGIHANVYGHRADHPDRWRADDSLGLVERLRPVSVLLIHGSKDEAVLPRQSRVLAQRMTELGAAVSLHEIAGAGHDWALWRAQTAGCIAHLLKTEE